MKVSIILKRGNRQKLVKEREAKLLVKAGYATYAEAKEEKNIMGYETRQLKAADPVNVPVKRGRPKKEKADYETKDEKPVKKKDKDDNGKKVTKKTAASKKPSTKKDFEEETNLTESEED